MAGSFIEKLLTSAIKNDRSYLVLVSGQQGIGKTSFAIHAAYIAYGNYAKALRRLYFEASDFFKDTASFTGPQPAAVFDDACLLYTSPSPRDRQKSRMPSSA